MNILFAHRVYPGQFRNLLAALAAENKNQIKFLALKLHEQPLAEIEVCSYEPARKSHPSTHPCISSTEDAVLFGQAAYRAAGRLKQDGFKPDVIFGHSGWGPNMFLGDLFPQANYLSYFEWFYRAKGSSHGFHPNIPLSSEHEQQIRTKNVPILMDLQQSCAGVSPTYWQKQQFPLEYQHKIEVIHDGVNCDYFFPERQDLFLPRIGLDLRGKREIVTYVATGMEPMRGFPEFMRAVSRLQQINPRCEVVIVGEDRTEYSNPLASGKSYRQLMMELYPYDASRLHFTGRLSTEEYRQVLNASSVHVYLTFPFILSWSMLEAMACGCVVVASSTPPVQEVVRDGENGLLVDFFDTNDLCNKIAVALNNPTGFGYLRVQARETILRHYEARDMLRRQYEFIRHWGGAH